MSRYCNWDHLLDYLYSLSNSQLAQAASFPGIRHYIVRAVQPPPGDDAGEEAQLVKIAGHLQKLFPAITETITAEERTVATKRSLTVSGSPVKFEASSQQLSTRLTRKRSHTYSGFSRDLYRYCPEDVPVTYRSREITLADLTASADHVIQDTLAIEKSLHAGLQGGHRAKWTGSTSGSPPKAKLEPIVQKTDQKSSSCKKSPGPVKTFKVNAKIENILRAQMFGRPVDEHGQCVLKTGVDVVYAFAKNALPSNTQEVYLRCFDSMPFNPYSLTVVPKSACPSNSEYYIATKFGLLQIYPGGECFQQSFASWMRDSMIFNIIRNIPVFRDYLTRKMLQLWHKNVLKLHYTVNRRELYRTGLCFYPPFSLALWKLNSLCQDLLVLELHTIAPLGNYDQDTLSEQFKASKLKVFKYIQKFFKYSQRIINEVVASTYSRVLELETRKRHVPFVSDLPISIQKERHLQLERDLVEALHRKTQLERLCIASQQIVTSHLMRLVNENAKEWFNIVYRVGQSETFTYDTMMQECPETSDCSLDVESYTSCVHEEPDSLLKAELLVTNEGIYNTLVPHMQ